MVTIVFSDRRRHQQLLRFENSLSSSTSGGELGRSVWRSYSAWCRSVLYKHSCSRFAESCRVFFFFPWSALSELSFVINYGAQLNKRVSTAGNNRVIQSNTNLLSSNCMSDYTSVIQPSKTQRAYETRKTPLLLPSVYIFTQELCHFSSLRLNLPSGISGGRRLSNLFQLFSLTGDMVQAMAICQSDAWAESETGWTGMKILNKYP